MAADQRGRGPEKPPRGQACNGCGLCCAMEQCQVSVMGFGELPAGEICPALTFDAGRFWCRLVLIEAALPGPKLIAEALGIGTECTVEDG